MRFTDSILGQVTIDFVEHMLALDPSKRLTPLDLMKQDYFAVEPYPAEMDQLPKPSESLHEYQIKERNKKRRTGRGRFIYINASLCYIL